jgi:uncharacterized protein (TIGR00369 family)
MSDLDPDVLKHVEKLFSDSSFLDLVGLTFERAGPGWCETGLKIEESHGQQDGWVHAGVMATIADHTAGAAAMSLVEVGTRVLTIEFKVNFLRPAVGERLRCRGRVLKPGRTIMVAESEIFSVDRDEEKLAAKATVTLAIVRG